MKRQIFIATNSKSHALRKSGLSHPIAIKVHGGYVVLNRR